MKLIKFRSGIDALNIEANTWWGGLPKMEQVLGLTRDELQKYFWPVDIFNPNLSQEEVKVYEKEEIEIAAIFHGRVYPEKVLAYKAGKDYLVDEVDYQKILEILKS